MAFNEALHPRVPAGGAGGGEFGSSGKATSAAKAPAKATAKAPAKTAPAKKAAPPAKKTAAKTMKKGASGALTKTLSYDAKSNRGAGYGMPNGDPHVKQLQQALNRLGLVDSHGKKLKVDGKLGPLTTSAIKAAQKRLGLKQDGLVTPAFFTKLLATKSTHKPVVKKAAAKKAPGPKPVVKRPRKPVVVKVAPKPRTPAPVGNRPQARTARSVMRAG